MHGMRRIGIQFYGDGVDVWFSSLEELSVVDFPNLEECSSAINENSFSSLRKLILKRCCTLTLTSISNLSLLSVLVLDNIPGLFTLPEGLIASPCLSSLKIMSFPKLRSLPLPIGNLTALKSLTIAWCEELSSLPQTLQNLKALDSMEISNCHEIISMLAGWMVGLEV
ncbi:disease resistance protein RGA3 [Pyrus ussuriensis x Pyrus communis]|uniref:Disease resistance protein RGA3 n=1 Tax=Pyrus ussuriensis x Pyrus communis TaxID=2448454 RepID=A0A5N5GUN7_9ROSA|nr:disease resistance protein RGA3 [Pyrus ussuriensis x Pyrus communis]